jgi:hypothetical protein
MAKKTKQKADKKDDKAMPLEREYGRRSTTPRSAARRSSATAPTPSAKRTTAMPSPARKPAAAAKRPAAGSRKGTSAKKRSGK